MERVYLSRMEKEVLRRIQNTIARYEMLQIGDKVVVGVSGGADSVALLSALHRLQDHYQLTLWVAHYDHRLRGEESDKEAAFVRTRAKELGIGLIGESDDGSLLLRHNNLEEMARRRRYRFFRRVASELGAQKVALGHTANDQAETFFLWVFRGAGTKGLGGIPPVREGFFIRPLIEIERREIKTFLQKEGISWLDDSSNQKQEHLRNRIRQTLIPKLLAEFDPNLIEKVRRTTEIVRDEECLLEALSIEKFKALSRQGKEGELCFEISELQELPIALKRRIIRHAIREAKGTLRRIHFAHMEAVLDILKSRAPNLRISLPGGLQVLKEYEQLKFCEEAQGKVRFRHEFNALPAEIWIPELNCGIQIKVSQWDSKRSPRAEGACAFIDFDTLRFPLIVRSWEEGDRFQPLGMTGQKKVKDFFMDVKLPRRERERIPIVLFGDMVSWIGGQRIDDRVKVTDSTKKILELDMRH